VPDQVVGQLTEVVGGDDGAGELLELVVMDAADGVDQVIQPDGVGRSGPD
jgi:hypothetical protein